jgi:hypothetical protein
MADCLECQRLRKKYDELEALYTIQANMWLMLKRFILEQEEKNNENNDVKKSTDFN